ncbi:MAG: hypothetical protein ABSE62_15530 [Chthoniobacteraceae bacterium]
MPRAFFLVLFLGLAACQGDGSHHSTSASAPSDNFDSDTVQTYNLQTADFQQQSPWGACSNQSQ